MPIPGRNSDSVILVDERNRAVGTAGKEESHLQGMLHRAFSIFLVDEDARILLQRRSRLKYHSAGLWANSCCGHPRPREATRTAAERRLTEELNVSAPLRFGFTARYTARVSPTMVENELVYVYFGALPSWPRANPDEVEELRALALPELCAWAEEHPDQLAVWMRHYLRHHREEIARALERFRLRQAAPAIS